MTIIPNPFLPEGQGWKAMAISAIAALGFGLSSGVVYAIQKSSQANDVFSSQPSTGSISGEEKQLFTLSDYNRIEIGMTLAQVELILEPGTEKSRSDSIAAFSWQNSDGSYIRLLFEQGKVTSKEQNGLSYLCPARLK